MTAVTIIGTGNIGSAVAAIVAKAGADVQVLGRDQEKASALATSVGGKAGSVGDPIAGDIVVLAVFYPVLAELAETYGSQLDGKVVVETTNPVDFATFDSLLVPADSSATAELQAKLPRARVLKAFNTNLAATLASGLTGDAPVTVMVAGDDETARQALVDLVTAGGLAATSVGSLKRARDLESFGFLQLILAAQGTTSWAGGFAVRK